MKRQYAEQQKSQSRMPTRPLVDPPPGKRIEEMLGKFESGEVSAWWRLNMEMTLEPYEQAPEAVIESLLAIIDKEPSVLRKMGGCVDAKLSAALLAKLGDSDLSAGTMGSVLGILLTNGVSEARAIAESLVGGVASGDDKALAKAKIAARLLLTETEDAGWAVVWPALDQDAEFAEEVISNIAHWGNRGSSPLFPKLSVDQLADLYVWLVRRYPPSEDPQHKGVYSVGPRDSIGYWRNAVLDSLKRRGTPEACIAIETIAEQLPHLLWLRLVLLEAQQIARRETWKPPSPSDVTKMASYSKLVLSLHGIRTRGAWQKELNSEIQDAGLKHVALDYGFFGVLKLLIPYFRRRQVEWFRDEYTKIRERYPSETPSVIAHSFGTYLVASALELYRETTFDRIIFSGSIVRQDFDWSGAISRGQVNGVLNECAKRDIWVKLGSWLISDAGPSGARGFNDAASGSVRQRYHDLFTHSDYLYSLNYHENWIPFLRRGEPNELELSTKRRLNIRFVAFLAGTLVLLILLAWLVLRKL